MIRHLCLALVALVMALHSHAQQLADNYSFSASSGTYSAISGGTVVASGTGLDEQRYLVSLPFTFSMNGTDYTQAYISVNGYLAFGADPGTGVTHVIASGATGFSAAAGFATNLASLNSTTELMTQTSGSSPNRTFTIQWKNFGYPSSTALTTNFQIKLKEATHAVEVTYGTVTLTGSTSQIAVQAGVRGTNNAYFTARGGLWSSSSSATSNTDNFASTPTHLPTSGQTFIFSPPLCTTPTNQPTNIAFSPGSSSINVSWTAASPAVQKYLVVRTPNTPLSATPVNGTTYSVGGTLGNGTIVYAGASTSFTNSSLSGTTYYTYTVFAYNDFCAGGPLYKTTSPISGTARTTGPDTYTWIATSGTGDFNTATNWSPTRTSTFTTDTLVFGNGGTPTVTNVPNQSLAIIKAQNSTSVNLISSSTAALTVGSVFSVESGSSVALNNALTLKYSSGGGKTATIGGKLYLGGSSVYDANNSITTITGTVVDSGANAEFKTTCTTCSDIIFDAGGTYEHARNGGVIPRAFYHPSSTVKITGTTNTAPTHTSGQTFGNYTWACAGQTAGLTPSSALDTIKGNLTIQNTNTYAIRFAGTSNQIVVQGDFIQSAGTYQVNFSNQLRVFGNAFFNNGVVELTGNTLLYFYRNFVQGSGHLFARSNNTISGQFHFTGSTNQSVSVAGGDLLEPSYTLNNPAGATLSGTIKIGDQSTNNIIAGAWSGTGNFNYTHLATLAYSTAASQTTTNVEWPAANGPQNILLDLTGNSPNDRIYLHASRTVKKEFEIEKGVFVLGPNNLTIDTNCMVNMPIGNDQTAMIAADSTGQLIKYIGAGSGYFNFPVGDITGDAEYTPANLSWATNSIARYVGVRVADKKHASNTATNNTISRYWSFTDNGGSAPYTYTAQFMHTAADLAGATDYRLNRWNGSTWQQLPSYSYIYTFFTPDRYFVMTPNNVGISSATYPLGGSDFTAMPSASNTYVWTNAAADKNYQNPNNWNPVRTTPDPADRLVFNSGNRDTVTNIGDQVISRITFTNYTKAVFSAATSTATKKILSIGGDNDPATLEMAIDSGSAMYVTGTVAPLEINFTPGTNSYIIGTAKAEIAGRLEIENAVTGVENGIRFPGCVGVVKKSGWLASGFNYDYSSGYGAIFCDPTSLKVFGTYEHKYTINNGSLPRASWEDGSLVLINSITTSNNVATFNYRPSVYDLTYNCPNQTSALQWYGTFPNVRGTAKIISTGTGSMVFTSTSSISGGYTHDINNFEQTGGTINFSSVGAGSENVTLNIAGHFLQTGGTFFNTSTASGNPVLHFNGTSGRQNVNFYNAAPAGLLTYRISNPAGINLTGSGTLTGTFNINNNGRLQISSAATYPVTSALKLMYANNAVLVYDVKANCVSDTVAFPVQNGPAHLITDLGAGNKVTLPGSRTITGSLTMTSGDIDITDDTLTIGTSVTSTGSINYNAGNIRMTTGALQRWYGSSGLPTTPGTGAGFYPIGYNNLARHVSLYFSTGIALNPGGTISVSYNHIDGVTTGLSVSDGSFTINNRTNASWKFDAGNGIALASASIGIRITGAEMFGTNTPANLRLMKATTTVGSHVAGSGTSPNFMAQRSTLSFADLTTGNFHIGSDNNSLSPLFISVTDGKWKHGNTWNQGIVPPADAYVIVRGGDTVTVDTTTAIVRSLTVNTGGSLFVNDSTLTVDSTIVVNGALALTKGTVNLYFDEGGKSPFLVNGVLSVSGGRMNINGNLNISSTATFNQSGGDIYIDGNRSNVSSVSVPNGTHLFHFAAASSNVTGGNIIIIDPPVGSGSNAVNVANNVSANFGAGHNLIIGDGVSIQSTASTNGFNIYSPTNTLAPFMRFGNLVIKGSPLGTNRRARQTGYLYLNGNLSLENTNAYYDMLSTRLYIKGNITAGSGTTLKTTGEIHFAESNTAPATSPQTVSGAGRFETSTTIWDNNFTTLSVNNTSASGVTMNIGNVYYTDKLLFVKGVLNMGSNILTRNGTTALAVTTASQNTGWVAGRFQQVAVPGTYTFPIGDAASYTPVTLSVPSGVAAGTGFVRARTIAGDHSAIASGVIQAAKSINRQYIIDGIAPGSFTSDGATMTLGWQPADADGGITSPLLTAQKYTGTAWADLNITGNTPTSITISGVGTQLEGTYQVGQPELAPVVVQQPASRSVCIGDDAVFSVSANYAAGYQWQVLTGGVWTNIANVMPYMDATTANLYIVAPAVTMNGTQYRCRVYNGFDTTNTNAVTLSVGTTAPASLTISTASNTVCAGAPVTFTATPVNGGTTPSYQWKKNNVNIGANSATYTTSTLATGDIITCSLTSSLGCANPATATSNSITMTVNPTTPPAVTVTANPGNTVCTGTNVNFTAAAANAGLSPTYQWKKNGSPVGTNSATYASNALVTNDAIVCEVTSSNTCASTATVASTAITMTVNSFVTPSVTIAAAPGNAICAGTSVTFTATPTNGGTTPSYQWQVNNVNAGTNSNTFTSTTLAQGDVVKCILTGSDACATVATATSTGITMTVTPTVLPAVSVAAAPGNTICAGTSVTFTATPTNGGTAPSYQWKVNNVNAGTNANVFTTTSLAYGDVVTCEMTSSALCATPAKATSPGITMTVNPNVTPTVTIWESPGSVVCAGTSVTFAATTVHSGFSPTYQWKVNNVNVGTNASTYTSSTLSNNDVVTCVLTSSHTCVSSPTATSNTITMTVMPNVALTASISANPGNTICDGTQVFFTATTNSGLASYDWKLNGVSAGVNSATVVSNTLQNGNTISCTITDISGACMTSTTASSNTITMVVNPIVTPTVTVVPNTTGTVCAGVPVTFTANATHGGTAPVYKWELNGNPVGTNSSTYTTALNPPSNTVQCTVTSNAACATSPTAWDGVLVTTNPSLTPAVTITANPGVNVGPYTPVTFTANPTNGGIAPLYQWLKNGVGIPGQTGNTYTGVLTVDFNTGDKISVRLTSDEECAQPAIVSSNELTMQVNVGVGEQNNLTDLTLSPNPNTGKFRLKGMLKGTGPDNNAQVSIINMLGQVVYTTSMPVTGNEVDLMVEMPAHFTDGTYTLRVTRGESSYTSRFVLQRF